MTRFNAFLTEAAPVFSGAAQFLEVNFLVAQATNIDDQWIHDEYWDTVIAL